MKTFLDITTNADAFKMKTHLNSFRGIECEVAEKKTLRIWFDDASISEKWILKLVGMFNRQKTGKRTKVTSIKMKSIL